MPNFDEINVGINLARLNKVFAKQVAETARVYMLAACPTGDRSAMERFAKYLEQKDE